MPPDEWQYGPRPSGREAAQLCWSAMCQGFSHARGGGPREMRLFGLEGRAGGYAT
jgi:hypothetical protein